MTSAPNRLRQLSGNSIYLLFVLFTIAGCSSVKSGQKSNQPSQPQVNSDIPQVYNPETGKYEPVDDPKVLVDTIEFIENESVEPVESVDDVEHSKKSVYQVALLIPLNAGRIDSFYDGIDPKLRRFIHYYAGVRMGLRDLSTRGIRLETNVYDTRESAPVTERLIKELKRPDVLIGPYTVESLAIAENYAREKRIPLFSPWTPSIPVNEDNPYFVQLLPGLSVHAAAIANYIDGNFSGSKVFLTARNDERETSRFALYQDAHMMKPNAVPYQEFIIDDESADLNETPLTEMLSEDSPTIFILPHYSRRDEDFIASFLRKLHAEQGKREVYVFGLPQWPSFPNLRPDYLESTNVHISSSYHVEYSDPDVREFQQAFFNQYGTIPEQSAFQGYDFITFLGESLFKYGTGFLNEISDPSNASDAFKIEPVYSDEKSELKNKVRVYENHSIHILRFIDQKFRNATLVNNR